MPRLARYPLAIVLVAACAADPDALDESTTGDDAASGSDDAADGSDTDGGDESGPAASGEELFLQYCAGCHGQDAMGTELAYELRHPPREYATWVVRNGRPGDEFPSSAMAAFPPSVLSDADLDAIFDHLDAFPQPTTPEGLYLDYCRNCHGTDARGGVVAKDISDKELEDVLEKVREGENTVDPGARILYMPRLSSDVLSDDELAAIAEHIASL